MGRIVVTGGAGFIGSNLSRALLAEGHEILLLDNLSTSLEISDIRAHLIEVDVGDLDISSFNYWKSADALFHLAEPSSGMASARDPIGTLVSSYKLAMCALELAKHLTVDHFTFASTMGVYGNVLPENLPVKEDAPCNPESHYSIAKFAVERCIETFCRRNFIHFQNLRLFNVYGPGQDLNRLDQGIVSIFLAMLLDSPEVISKGSIKRVRDVVHIKDVVKALLASMDTSFSGPINVGSGIGITVEEMIQTIGDELGYGDKVSIKIEDNTIGDLHAIYANISLLQEISGIKDLIDPRSGIRSFTQWAKENA